MNLIDHWMLVLSTIMLVASIVIITIFNIPLQIREAKVKNGLAKLRKQLLGFGFTLIVTNVIALYFIGRSVVRIANYHESIPVNVVTEVLLTLFSFSHLILAIIGYFIYHQQYTDEHKAVSAKLEKLTNKRKRTTI